MKEPPHNNPSPSPNVLLQLQNQVSRRRFLQLLGYTGTGMGLTVGLEALHRSPLAEANSPGFPRTITADHGRVIRVGILHSLSGVMASLEKGGVEAELLAIAEINQQGGVLGKRIEPVVEDSKSDWTVYREKALKLIKHHQVATVFGGWTSASRKAMLPVFEDHNHMLWYPATYEGQECSRNIFYTGAVPNQHIEPTILWVLSRFPDKPIFLIGSDYVFPRVVNTVIKGQLASQTKRIVGEHYVTLGVTVTDLVRTISRQMPEGGVILNSTVGDTNAAFFQQMGEAGMLPQQYPVISVNLPEEEIATIGASYLQGHFIASSYLQTVNTAANQRFVKAFQAKYGQNRPVTSAMQAAYIAVYLWKRSVEKAGTATDLEKVRKAAIGQRFNAPEGEIMLTKNHHLTKYARVGQIRQDGLYEIVHETRTPVIPQPWSQRIRETRGFACDWSNPANGGKYRV